MIYVPTIPHTGTHFLRDHLLANEKTYVEHIWPEKMADWRRRLLISRPIVVPIRHPFAVAASWKRREKNVLELPDWWSRLYRQIDEPYEVTYIPLDSPHRQHFLDELNEELGTSITTDWPVIREGPGQYRGDAVPLTPREYETTRDTWRHLEAFFARFYTVGAFAT